MQPKAKFLDGKSLALEKRKQFSLDARKLTTKIKRPPFLAVILVGDDPASHIYVSHKEKACAAVGIETKTIRLASSIDMKDLNFEIENLNQDKDVDAILLQLPLPKHLDRFTAVNFIDPSKDVDGLTQFNQGALLWKNPRALIPCTPLGIMELIRTIPNFEIRGKIAAVLGRSVLVGGPIGTLLEQSGASLISMHSGTIEPWRLTLQADIVVAATGVKGLVKGNWIKPGAVVIDVGIHRDGNRIIGDCDFEELSQKASYITPVPGGVGPMTIAMLLSNCLRCCMLRMGDS